MTHKNVTIHIGTKPNDSPRFVRFKPSVTEEWGVSPNDRFIVEAESPSGKSFYINFKGHTAHVSKTILVEDETMDVASSEEAERLMREALPQIAADTKWDAVQSKEWVGSNPFIYKALRLVSIHVSENFDKSDEVVPGFNVYVVWFCKVLQNWKALVSTTLPDQMYYEVTYNGDKGETYIDAYKKVRNFSVKD